MLFFLFLRKLNRVKKFKSAKKTEAVSKGVIQSQRNVRDKEFEAREAGDMNEYRRWSATKKSEVYGVSTLINPFESASSLQTKNYNPRQSPMALARSQSLDDSVCAERFEAHRQKARKRTNSQYFEHFLTDATKKLEGV